MRYRDIIAERVEMISIDSYAIGRGRRTATERVKKVKLYVNPSQRELQKLATTAQKLRFIIGEDDSLYVCDANEATHFDIVHHAGIDEKYAGYIAPEHISLRRDASVREMAPILRANPHILDAMGGATFLIDRNQEIMADF
jgi:hypothetical protein